MRLRAGGAQGAYRDECNVKDMSKPEMIGQHLLFLGTKPVEKLG